MGHLPRVRPEPAQRPLNAFLFIKPVSPQGPEAPPGGSGCTSVERGCDLRVHRSAVSLNGLPAPRCASHDAWDGSPHRLPAAQQCVAIQGAVLQGSAPALPWGLRGTGRQTGSLAVRFKPQANHSFRDLCFADRLAGLSGCLGLWTCPRGTSLRVSAQSPERGWGLLWVSGQVVEALCWGVSTAGCSPVPSPPPWAPPHPGDHPTLGTPAPAVPDAALIPSVK